jgi:hypothetical protein
MRVIRWRMLAAVLLLAPRAGAQVSDHLACYKVRDPLELRGVVDVDAPAVGLDAGCKIKRATKLCVPAAKTVLEAEDRATKPPTPITPRPVDGMSAAGVVCYKVRCPKDQPPAGDQTVTDQFAARTLEGGRLLELCTPIREGLFVGGAWSLTGSSGPEVCPAPPFPNVITILQTGTALTAFDGSLSFSGSATASGFELAQSGTPSIVPCPGGYYDAFLNLTGTPDAGGTFRVIQHWTLSPPVSLPDCPPCSKSSDGVMTPLAAP